MDMIEKKREYLSRRRYGGNRNAVLSRDNFSCVLCGEKNFVIVHHKMGLKYNDINDLVTLCRACHFIAHNVKNKLYKKRYERAGEIMELRNEGRTLDEIGGIFGISRERVRQIESWAREQLL